MTVLRNMAFSLELRNEERGKIEIKAGGPHRLRSSSLSSELLDRLPRQLSGGQRQRVAMGRAIVRQPSGLPVRRAAVSNLDAKLQGADAHRDQGAAHEGLRTTTVYVTHDQVEAMTMADRIVVMHDGVIQQVGGPLEIYDRPANRFVAGFIGSPAMNFFEGVVRRDGDSATVRTTDDCVLPVPSDSAAVDGQSVTYGVRPEALTVLDTADGGVPATVEVIEPTGLNTLVFAKMGTQPACALTMDRPILERGQPIWLVPDIGKVHLFDAQSGARI